MLFMLHYQKGPQSFETRLFIERKLATNFRCDPSRDSRWSGIYIKVKTESISSIGMVTSKFLVSLFITFKCQMSNVKCPLNFQYMDGDFQVPPLIYLGFAVWVFDHCLLTSNRLWALGPPCLLVLHTLPLI